MSNTNASFGARIPAIDSRVQWRDAKSEKGVPFKIGTLKTDDATDGIEAAVGAKDRTTQKLALFNIEHDVTDFTWAVGADTWKDTSQHIKDKVDITRYCLVKGESWFYDYTLHITNTQPWDYRFYIEGDDSYVLDTFLNGDHYVSYTNDKPNIVRIHARGSV